MPSAPLPGLYIVATPIGNLGDLTLRAASVLRHADLVAAEDTRVTATLLAHIGAAVRMLPYHDHSDAADRSRILAAARDGVVALVSDAGTPLISDPGYRLVRQARAEGIPVVAVPGPSALTAAASIAGLPTDRLLFAGFLPPKPAARARAIAELGAVRATLVLYESGPRTPATLAALAEALGRREAAVARELTKRFEEVALAPLPELAARYADAPPRGEVVLLIAPPVDEGPTSDDAAVDAALDAALATMRPAQAAKQVAAATGRDRAELYAKAIARKAGR